MALAAAPEESAAQRLEFSRSTDAVQKADALAKALEARKALLAGPKTVQSEVFGGSVTRNTTLPSEFTKPPYADDDIVRVTVEVDAKAAADVALNSRRMLTQMSNAEVAEAKAAALKKVAAVEPAAEALGAKVRQRFGVLLAGFSAEIEYGQIEALKKVPGVKDVTLVNRYQLDNRKSTELIGATDLHNADPSIDGTGIVIAIIDTGINYQHEAFGSQKALDPNGKVIAGWNFADDDATVYSAPGTSPHGTHVAGTAAGMGPYGGVAPGAKLIAQKVFSNNPEFDSAFGDDILAALEDSILDTTNDQTLPAQRRHPRADVINMSLGSPSGWVDPNDASIKGVDKAVAAGVVVTISAGNSSHNWSQVQAATGIPALYWNQDLSTLGSPSVFPGSISVAASHNNVVWVSGPTFTPTARDSSGAPVDLSALEGKLITTEGSSPVPWSSLGTGSHDLVLVNNLGCDVSDVPDEVAGKVALVSRGSCTFQTKADTAAAKGALAVIVYNNASDDQGVVSMAMDDATIPGAMVLNSVGTTLRNVLAAGGSVSARFNGPTASLELPGPLVDTITDFSSWGTAPDLSPKPDVTAPGQNILSPTWAPNTYENYQGTSMAAPHVAGAAALIKQAHPNYGPAEVKLALMNTAKVLMQGDVPYSPRQQGAGRIQVDRAIETPVLAAAKTGLGIGTGHLALGQVAEKSRTTFQFELRNLSDEDLTYTVPAVTTVYRPQAYLAYFHAYADEPWEGAVVRFNETSYTVPAGGTVTVTGELDLSDAELAEMALFPGYGHGHFAETFITLTSEDGKPDLSMPLQAFVGDWSKLNVIETDDQDWCILCFTGIYDEEFYQLGWNYSGSEYDQDYIAISPNGDGLQDGLYSVASFIRNAKSVTVDVINSKGSIVRRIGSQSLVRNQRATTEGYLPQIYGPWDARAYNPSTGYFEIVPEGEYAVQIKALPATGNTWQVYTFPVKVDVTAPSIEMALPRLIAENTVEFDITASDGNSGLWGHYLIADGNILGPVSPKATSVQLTIPIYSEVPIDIFTVTFDHAGNTAVDGWRVTYRVPELLEVGDSYKSHPGGELSFDVLSGSVTRVAYKLDNGAWADATLADGKVKVTLPEDLSNGLHTLAFEVFQGTAMMRSYRTVVDVSDVPPTIAISSPQQKSFYNSRTVPVIFEAADGVTVKVNGEVATSPTTITFDDDGEKYARFELINEYGNTATRSVSFYVDTTPPVVELEGVSEDGVVTTEEKVYTLRGTVSDALLPYELYVNGNLLYQEGNMADEAEPFEFEWPVDLTQGTNYVLIQAVDYVGNAFQQIVTVTRVPQLKITHPTEGQKFNTNEITLTFVHEPGATVTYDGTEITSGHVLVLEDGEHTVQLVATNGDDVETAQVTFYVDTTAPVISLSSTDDVTQEAPTYRLTGTVEDLLGFTVTVKVNGEVVATRTGSGSYTLNETLSLAAGENVITVEAVDELGHEAAAVSFTVTRKAATLSGLTLDKKVFSPALNQSVKATVTLAARSTLTVEVRDAEGNLVKTLLNASTKSAGKYTYSWNGKNGSKPVADGIYTIIATTSAGGYFEEEVEVDSTKPTIENPTYDPETNTLSATSDAEKMTVKLSGAASKTVTLTKAEDTDLFSGNAGLTKDGKYTATFEATDAAGNKSTAKITFTVDLDPVLTVTNPETVVSKSKTVKLSGKTTEKLKDLIFTGDGFTVKKKTLTSSTSWSAELAFDEDGSYDITVAGVDATGNESAAIARTIVIDTTAPVFTEYKVESGKLYVRLAEDLSGIKSGSVKVKFGSSAKTATWNDDEEAWVVSLPSIKSTVKVYLTATDGAGNVRSYPSSSRPDFTLSSAEDTEGWVSLGN